MFTNLNVGLKFALKQNKNREKVNVLDVWFVVCLKVFSFVRVVLYTVLMVFPLPETLAKNLVKNLAKNLDEKVPPPKDFWPGF